MVAEAPEIQDVIIVGAGISGINAAYRVQSELPGSSYVVLEARGGMGGTWDFFRYPGIRSDSDLYTFGFPWRPWDEQKAIADGAQIRKYIQETAASEGIDKHIRYHHKVISANWSSEQQLWTITCDVEGDKKVVRGKFVMLGTGYYDYDEAMPATIPGIENYKGTIVHPQFWPEDLDYANKRMVVIGSGATAVTLLPSLAEKAEHVTMLQRSPGYLLSRPAIDIGAQWTKKILPAPMAHFITRMKFLIIPWLFFNFCRHFPSVAKLILRRRTTRQLPKTLPHDPHFSPAYNPWEQRLCMCPDGDFFNALRAGKSTVVTGHIATCTDKGITLKNGETLDADIIVTATGLKVQMIGGADLYVDNERVNLGDKYLWKGVMVQDIPNAGVCIGYTNASWTLGADASARLMCRLIKNTKSQGAAIVVPRVHESENLKPAPTLNLSSTYITRATHLIPKAGDSGPWKAKSSYFNDLFNAKYGDIKTGLEYIDAVSA